MTDQEYVTLFAALTIGLCLVSRLEGASSGAVRVPLADWRHFAEQVAHDVAETPMPAISARTETLCAAVTTLVPIPCFRE